MAEREQKPKHRGPWYHRALVWVFSIVFGLLIFWLLGFFVNDLGTWPGPELEQVEKEILDQELVSEKEDLNQQLESVKEHIDAKQERQSDLRDSTDSAEKTMNRLLDIQRLALEKDIDLSEQEKHSLADAKDLFLSNQKQYQETNQEIADLKEDRRTLEGKIEDVEEQLEEQRDQARKEFMKRQELHEIKMAAFKLAVLVPLLIVSALMYVRWRRSTYVPLIHAFAIATALKVGTVMHEHFPSRYFKYILISVSIVIVATLLVRLLRHMARPATDWLLQQYREAYERFVCPVCEFPIRRGPLRFHYWNRRTIKRLNVSPDRSSENEAEPYVCPACATSLYDKCDECGKMRPTLMRACPHCGNERSPTAIVAAVGAADRQTQTNDGNE